MTELVICLYFWWLNLKVLYQNTLNLFSLKDIIIFCLNSSTQKMCSEPICLTFMPKNMNPQATFAWEEAKSLLTDKLLYSLNYKNGNYKNWQYFCLFTRAIKEGIHNFWGFHLALLSLFPKDYLICISLRFSVGKGIGFFFFFFFLNLLCIKDS